MKKVMNETIDIKSVGQTVTLAGWVAKKRDLGGLIFIDLRDDSSIIQLVVNPDNKNYAIADSLKSEYVIEVTGKVVERSAKNPNLKTGDIEIEVEELVVLNTCEELPFPIADEVNTSDDNRLKYRYLDIRRNRLRDNLNLRSEVLHFLRNKMYDLGFNEVQTPILTASSPEGARDFVVPSRLFPGKFYALPQAPQIYKELLMVGGFSKYFQIAPCFRDEDARADRTLEFYQLDLEMAFVEEDDVLAVGEDIFYDVFKTFSNKEVTKPPFRRIAYKDAMEDYGSDKPDLRNPLIIKDASEVLKDTEFGPFKKSNIKVIVVDDIGENSNSWFNDIVDFASSIGMPGIGYITLMEDGSLKGPIDKFLSETERKDLIEKFDMKTNSVMFFIANKNLKTAQKFAGEIRNYVGEKCGLIDHNKLELCIVNDFPMFEWKEDEKKWDFCHNPFSLPHGGIEDYDREDKENILAYQYDFVCNGNEMASGAIRNHDLNSLAKGFEIVGYKREEVEERFKSIFTAFKYGCPPHGGMAPGLDRILMLIKDEPNLREVQAFPTSASGADLMMGSPAELMPEQLEELGIEIKKVEE